ncbi:uncharacterized [Tachysurus ichikawai]
MEDRIRRKNGKTGLEEPSIEEGIEPAAQYPPSFCATFLECLLLSMKRTEDNLMDFPVETTLRTGASG